MKKNNYKIVLLSDMKDAIHSTLKSAISLAKMINGEIEVFHVKKPAEIVSKENQLSAIRSINSEHSRTDKELNSIIAPIAEGYGIPIKHSFAFGNVKNEIADYIEEKNPDIIVLGKKKSTPLNFLGDGVTQFVLNTFKGTVMIATDKNALEPDKEISLGVLNGIDSTLDSEFAKHLMIYAQKPLKSFKFVSGSDASKQIPVESGNQMIEYVFEHNDNTISNFPNYLIKNKINLLFLDRGNRDSDKNFNSITSRINNAIDKIDVTLLVSGEKKTVLGTPLK